MPTVLRLNGFRMVIYTADHDPMHVHAIHSNGEAVIGISSAPRVIRSGGLTDKELKIACTIVKDHAEMLASAWEDIHG